MYISCRTLNFSITSKSKGFSTCLEVIKLRTILFMYYIFLRQKCLNHELIGFGNLKGFIRSTLFFLFTSLFLNFYVSYVYTCSHVSEGVYTCVLMFAHMCVEVKERHQPSPLMDLHLIWKQGLSLQLNILQSGQPVCFRDSLSFLLCSWMAAGLPHLCGFCLSSLSYVVSEDPDSGPHAFAASTLSTKTHSQPMFLFKRLPIHLEEQ